MSNLFKHQSESVGFIRARNSVFDASDPGTGKTRVAIESFNERRLRGGGAALVLAPKSLLRSAWAADIKKFAPHLRAACAFATNREAAFKSSADFYITNHDAASWLAKQPPSFFKNFDTLIIDEIGAYKHNTAQRSKAVNKIKKYFKHRLGMNGTPSPNTIVDVWNQIFILDDGQRLGNSFYGFRAAVCTPVQRGPSAQMIKWVDREGSADAVSKLIEDMTIRHKLEDCVDIPSNFEYSVPYELSATQLKAYNDMKTASIALLNGKLVTAVNAAVVATKLLQISSGAVYESENCYQLVDKGRYEMALDLVEARSNTVVFFLWKHQRDQLMAEAKARGVTFGLLDGSVSDKTRAETVDFFQKGLYKTLFAHPQSAAHGLTLTKGVATIWVSPTYNLEHYQQGLKRIHRIGQTKKTETIVIVAPDTIEEQVWKALQNKKIQMTELLDQL